MALSDENLAKHFRNWSNLDGEDTDGTIMATLDRLGFESTSDIDAGQYMFIATMRDKLGESIGTTRDQRVRMHQEAEKKKKAEEAEAQKAAEVQAATKVAPSQD